MMDVTHDTSRTFQLLWTVGFSGKRVLPDEAKAHQAICAALAFLQERAQKQSASLTAISSLARGGDFLFAKSCVEGEANRSPIPWKCLVPFPLRDFLALDLDIEALEVVKSQDERYQRREAALKLLSHSFNLDPRTGSPEVTCPNINPQDIEARVAAYLECGYRTVDESDVMILLLRAGELNTLREITSLGKSTNNLKVPPSAQGNASLPLKAGTLAVAYYAIASRRPCILINADAPAPWEQESWVIANNPDTQNNSWFLDELITPVVQEAWRSEQTEELPPLLLSEAPITPSREQIWELARRLGGLASSKQQDSRSNLRKMLVLHLAASSIAALGATVLHYLHHHFLSPHSPFLIYLFLLICLLAAMKPVLAGWAWWIEHHSHNAHDREKWLHARVLQELCRGALAMWPLPLQPLDAADEEDFPKVKRLIRTLRLMREQDRHAAFVDTPRKISPNEAWESETQLEADMRHATQYYINHRLRDQAEHYYKAKANRHVSDLKRWRSILVVALATTIVLGLLLAGHKILEWPSFGYHDEAVTQPFAWIWSLMEAGVIICPFVASFALGWMTVLDCRRRAQRYPEMGHYLTRLANTLEHTAANPSRLRLIEQAERLMIEEQHEWFSVTRNFQV